MSPEQREVEQEEGSEGREEGQDSPIACGDDIHLYDNQISPGPGQYTEGGRGRWQRGLECVVGIRREQNSWIKRLRENESGRGRKDRETGRRNKARGGIERQVR